MSRHISLLELVQIQMNRANQKDLQNLDRWERKYLASKLDPIDAELPSLEEWNDIIRCVLQRGPACTKKSAKEQLLAGLRAG